MPWCATMVDRSGNVVHGKWEDCQDLCLDVSYYLRQAEGKCINKRRASTLARQINSGLNTTKLVTPSGFWSEVAPRCSQDVYTEISNSGPVAPSSPPSAEDCTEIKGRRVCCSDYGECSGYTGPDPTPWKRVKFTSCEYSNGHLQCDFSDNCSKIGIRMICCEDDGKCSGYNGPHPGSHPKCYFRDGAEICA